jgi:hypothetical protein
MASPAELVERQVCHVLVADGLLSIETQSLKAMAEEILKHWPRRKHLVEDIAFLMRSDTGLRIILNHFALLPEMQKLS